MGRLLVTIHALASHATNAARFVAVKRPLARQTDRQSDFYYRCSLFPLGENTRLDTHTQTYSATAVTTYAAFDFRDSSQGFVFSTLQSF